MCAPHTCSAHEVQKWSYDSLARVIKALTTMPLQ